MKLKDYILEQINHRETSPVPFTLGMEDVVSERLDKHYGTKTWRDWLTPYMFSDGFIDTTMEKRIDDKYGRDIFGGLWRYDRRPTHQEEPAMKEPSFDNYKFPTADQFIDPAKKVEARKAYEEHADQFRIGYIGWGLFEQSWRIRGFENVLMDVIAEPDYFDELLQRLADLYLAFVQQYADMPVDAIMFGDDWGDQQGVIIGPERWRKFIKPRWAKLYQAAHDQGKFVISHCCGSIVDIIPDAIEIGLDVYESVQPEARGMNPYQLKKKWGDKLTFWGCLGSQSTVPFGTPQAIRNEVKRLCKEMGQGGGYIIAPAKDLQPETSTENAVAVLESFTQQDK